MSRPSPALDVAAVEAAILSTQFAGQITYLDVTLSTMDLALKAAHSGCRHGVWIAGQQLAGRGRGANAWHSPAGAGLYMTALASPPIPIQSALALSFRVAVAVQSAIAGLYGLRVPDQIDIRWPNDLMIARPGAPQRKVAGILIDTASNPARAGQPATLRYAIIGIGINLNHADFPSSLDSMATSILRELPSGAQPLAREPLAAAVLTALDAELRALAANQPQPAACDCPDYPACSTWINGKRVRVEPRDAGPDSAGASYTGTTAGLTPGGYLLVRGDDGQLHTVLSGGLREP